MLNAYGLRASDIARWRGTSVEVRQAALDYAIKASPFMGQANETQMLARAEKFRRFITGEYLLPAEYGLELALMWAGFSPAEKA